MTAVPHYLFFAGDIVNLDRDGYVVVADPRLTVIGLVYFHVTIDDDGVVVLCARGIIAILNAASQLD